MNKTVICDCGKEFATSKIKEHALKCKQFLSNEHFCLSCGKKLNNYDRSVLYCSIECSHRRNHSDETKKKISETLKKSKPSKYQVGRKCPICGNELSKRNKTGYCSECISHSEQLKEYRRNRSLWASKFIVTPRYWKSRNQTSYAEKFWIDVLNNNCINYTHEYAVPIDKYHRYFLDFYIEIGNNKIDVEIDGKQHKYEDRKLHDELRDKKLSEMGFIVYRIEWNEINSDDGKELMKNKINDFLSFINKFNCSIENIK